MMPLAWTLVAGAALQTAILASAWWHGHTTGRAAMQAQLDAIHAVAAEQQNRYEHLQEAASNAQATIIDHYRRRAAADRRSWDAIRVQLSAAGTSDLPLDQPAQGVDCPGADTPVERDRPASPRPLPRAVADAVRLLEVGSELERDLNQCREQLRSMPCAMPF